MYVHLGNMCNKIILFYMNYKTYTVSKKLETCQSLLGNSRTLKRRDLSTSRTSSTFQTAMAKGSKDFRMTRHLMNNFIRIVYFILNHLMNDNIYFYYNTSHPPKSRSVCLSNFIISKCQVKWTKLYLQITKKCY